MHAHTLNTRDRGRTTETVIYTSDVADWAVLIGRVALAILFLWSGYGKITDVAHTVSNMTAHHMPMANVLVWGAILVELVGGAMLLVGWKTRWAALALAAYTMVAALIFHNFWAAPADQAMMQTIQFMKNVAITGGLLMAYGFGAGRYAIETR